MSLNFYICWTDSDPLYHDYYPGCNVLISLNHIPQVWNITRFGQQPGNVIVDSGAFVLLSNPQKKLLQKEVFNQQLKTIENVECPAILCHLDYPIPGLLKNPLEVYRRLEITIANAHEFMALFKSAKLPSHYKTMGIIQGHNYDTINFCARELGRLNFDYMGIGSLATLYSRELILERVNYALDAAPGKKLHIFGITGIQTINHLIKMGIYSFDSSRPMKEAIYNCIFYSQPFRRFVIKGSRTNRELPLLEKLLPCPCPVCKENPDLITGIGTKKAINYRALHNYYHLYTELSAQSQDE